MDGKGAASQREIDINDNRMKKSEKLDSKSDREMSPRPTGSQSKTNSAQSSDILSANKRPLSGSASPRPSASPVPKTESSSPQKSQSTGPDKSLKKEVPVSKKSDQNKSAVDNKSVKNENDKKEVKKDKDGKMAERKDAISSKGQGKNTGEKEETGKTTKRREKLKSEAEALDQLQETAENMIAGITILEVGDLLFSWYCTLSLSVWRSL